jgi:hypothetical protein
MTTIDLELAKELKGICKEKNLTMPDGYNWWIKNKGNKDIYTFPVQYIHLAECLEIIAPAYTLDELLEILPNRITYKGVSEYGLQIIKDASKELYSAAYVYSIAQQIAYWEFDSNPANAACKLLIHLIKEGLL